MFKSAHRVVLICTVIIFAVMDAGLYCIDFAGILLSGIASDNVPTQTWSLIGAVAWVASIILGGCCAGELIGRVRRR